MGLVAPCLIEPKLIVQESRRGNKGWDARLPQDLQEKFVKWKLELMCLDAMVVILMKENRAP